MREMKNQLGKDICNYMTENKLNNHIEISDGELRLKKNILLCLTH